MSADSDPSCQKLVRMLIPRVLLVNDMYHQEQAQTDKQPIRRGGRSRRSATYDDNLMDGLVNSRSESATLSRNPRPVSGIRHCEVPGCGSQLISVENYKMPRQIWLHTNHRVMLLGMVLPAMLLIWGLAMAGGWCGQNAVMCRTGLVLTAAAASVLILMGYGARLPRLAYQDGKLLVYLRSVQPICVPLEVVECFFLGQGSSELPKYSDSALETSTLVVRLAESAAEWHHRNVKRSLGRWCDGYITILGTWCEPLSLQRVNELNRRLADTHQLLKQECNNA